MRTQPASRPRPPRLHGYALLLLCAISAHTGAGELNIEVYGDIEVPIEHYRAQGDSLVLWLPSEHGVRPAQAQTARELAGLGHEVWVVDLHAAYFVPTGRASVKAFDPQAIADLIGAAHRSTAKQVYLMATGRGAQTALAGARAWQTRRPNPQPVRGIILIHPYLYQGRPTPGSEAHYLPIARAVNLPVYLIQPGLSNKHLRVQDAARALREGGSPVFVHALPEVTDGFHLRAVQDISPADRTARRRLPELLARAIPLLGKQTPPATAPALPENAARASASAASAGLARYGGGTRTPSMQLTDLQGRSHTLEQYRGEVVLLSFWTSWCPPCIEELPSLGRLQNRLAEQRFRVLSVDVAETRAAVTAFLQRVPVAFPVLYDASGETATRWGVYAYPTNYLIDVNGRIRYANYGALDWEAPEVLGVIQALLQEAQAHRCDATRERAGSSAREGKICHNNAEFSD